MSCTCIDIDIVGGFTFLGVLLKCIGNFSQNLKHLALGVIKLFLLCAQMYLNFFIDHCTFQCLIQIQILTLLYYSL